MIKIDEIFISSFGKLKNFRLSLNDNFNGICEDNGYGKTTIAIFIKAMFFGLNKNRSSKLADNQRKKYTPWESNEKFGGYLKFTVDGKSYRVERFFGKTPQGDTFALFDKNNLPCNHFDQDLGQQLFDIDGDSFERCLYIPQKEVTIDANDSFLTKLNKLVDNTDDVNNYDTARERLLQSYRNITSNARSKNQSKMVALQEKIVATQEKLYIAKQSYDKAQEHKNAIANTNNLLQQYLDKLDEFRERQKISDSKRALQNKAEVFLHVKNKYDQAKNRLDELVAKNADVSDSFVAEQEQKIQIFEEQKQKVSSLQNKVDNLSQPKQGGKSAVVFLLALALALVVAGVVMLDSLLNNVILLGVFCIVLVLVLALAFGANKKRQSGYKDAVKTNNQLKQEFATEVQLMQDMQNNLMQTFANHKIFEGNLHVALSQLKANKMVYAQALEDHRIALAEWNAKQQDPEFALAMNSGSIEKVDFSGEIKTLDEEVLKLTEQKARLQTEMETLLANASLASEFKNAIERAEEELKIVDQKAKDIMVAIECLAQAKTNLSQSFMPKIKDNFEGYISQITSGKYTNVAVDDKFTLRLQEKELYRDFDYFSKGIADLSLFCLRLALIDTMYGDNLPFLMLDDPFVNYDANNKQMALQLLNQRSKKCQVIYFTCNKA